MSTHAVICAVRADGRPQVSFIHYDGYPDNGGIGERLVAHYSTPEAVEALMAQGDLVILGDTPGKCERRKDDIHLFPVEADPADESIGQTLLRAVGPSGHIEWAYLFDGGGWECMASPARAQEWRGLPVEEAIRRKSVWEEAPFGVFARVRQPRVEAAKNMVEALEKLQAVAEDAGDTDNPWWFKRAAGIAAYYNNREGIKILLGFAAEFLPDEEQPEAGLASEALFEAADSPHLRETTVQLLLKAGADPNFSRGREGQRILHMAIDRDYQISPGIVSRLIAAGADVDALDVYEERTALERLRRLNGWSPQERLPGLDLQDLVQAAERRSVELGGGDDMPSPSS